MTVTPVGFYIKHTIDFLVYEANGNSSNSTIEEFKIEKDCTIERKKLIPVTSKKITVKIK